MADSTLPQPRPKPKPKPRPKLKASNDTASASTVASDASSPAVASNANIENEDDMFIRNRKRTTTMWRQLEELNKDTKTSLDDSDEESPANASPRKKKSIENRNVPRWQKDRDISRLLSEGLSDDSDSDVVEVVHNTSALDGDRSGKRKRKARSRSRSITPPPALPMHQIMKARSVVRQALNSAPRHKSPTLGDLDESTDTIVLDPELELIAQNITSRSQISPLATLDDAGEVVISAKWQPHPLNPAGKENVWKFKMKRGETFRELFEVIAEEAFILTDNLVICYNSKRIFSSTTPQTLQMWGEAEIVAHDKTTYEYLRTHPNATARSVTPAEQHGTETTDDDEIVYVKSTPGPSSQEPGTESEDSNADTLRLIFRSSITERDIHLTVRSTTKCGAIVKAFLKKIGVQGSKKEPRLCIDGEKMNNDDEISVADLEDGDLVEVVDL